MMKHLAAALAVLVLATAAWAADTDEKKEGPVEVQKAGKGKATAKRVSTIHAKVTAIDQEKRELTVQGPSGKAETFHVSPDVKRLNEIAVGDEVVLKYQQGLMLKAQEKGAADVEPTVGTATARTGAGEAPGGAAAMQIRSTVTVAAVDPKSRVVVLEGPEGGLYKVKAGSKVDLKKVKAGDKLFAVYTESLAVSVKKATAKTDAK